MSRINVKSKKNFVSNLFKKVNPFRSKAEKDRDEANAKENLGKPGYKGSTGNKPRLSCRNRKFQYHRKMRNKMERKSRRYNLKTA